MLGDTLSKARHASMNVLEVLKLDLDEFLSAYEEDKFYGAAIKRTKGKYVPDKMVIRKIDKLFIFFHNEDGKPMYQGKLCVPRKSISTVMQLARDARIADHFG